MAEDLTLWSHCRRRHGIVEALRDHFSETARAIPALALALAQVELAEAAIEQIMSTLVDQVDLED